MLFKNLSKKAKEKKKLAEQDTLAYNELILKLLTNMPVVATNTLMYLFIKDGIVHFSSHCIKSLKKERDQKLGSKATELYLHALTSPYLKKHQLNLCRKCLHTQPITGVIERVGTSSVINSGQALRLLAIFDDIFYLSARIDAVKNYNLEDYSVENLQEILDYQQRVAGVSVDLHEESKEYLTLIRDLPAEKAYFETLLEKAEDFCSKATLFLQSTKAKEEVDAAFLKIADLQKNKNAAFEDLEETNNILYGQVHSFGLHTSLLHDLRDLAENMGFPKNTLIKCYELLRLSIFINQYATLKTPINFTLLMPINFALLMPKKLTDLLTNIEVKLVMQRHYTVYEVDLAGKKPDMEALNTAYVLWEANDFHLHAYEEALSAALLL